MPTPGDLSICLERLLAAGLSNADYTRLHHFSLQGRRVYLTGGINYFGTHSALQGSNIALADRCMYVASQLEGGRTDKDSIIEEALNRWPLIPGKTDPSKAADSMRDYWLRQLRAIGPDFGVEPDDYNLASPTFRLGGWRVGVEHQRAFKSVVVQWIGPPEEVPEHPRRWKGCPPSDLDKGWQFRAPSSPEQLHKLLSELRDSQASKPAFVDQFSALGPAPSRETVVTVRDRAPAVRERVLQRAAGHCEWCGKLGFKTVSGAVYLETHHVIPLSDDGPDHETNVLALCPDDHRRAHHAYDRQALTEQLKGKLAELFGTSLSEAGRG